MPDTPSGEEPSVSLLLRLPRILLNRIDAVVHKRLIKIPRHTWILEALVEKLEREEHKRTP